LILFGAVQATMLLAALRSGERPRRIEWIGHLVAMIGLVVLVFPGLRAPSLTGSALMAVAGACWGIYSLRGRRAGDPIAATTANFILAAPAAVVVSLVALPTMHVSATGASLAVISGAVTSGVGYVVWYAALRGLTTTRAALVQLAVPALAAAGGVLFLAEKPSARFLAAAVFILGGIGAAVTSRLHGSSAPRRTE
jgi:drug/metabolite transporter (DMT)-like permease